MKKAYLNWSSGKDSALALYKVQKEQEYSVEKLVTTLSTEVDRVSMHGLRQELLLKQAQSLQLPLQLISLPGNVTMQEYSATMQQAVHQFKNEGFNFSVFGDIFLEDLREYRDKELKSAGLTGVYPLWKQNTRDLILEFINAGFKAITVCVNARVLDKSFCGRMINADFLSGLPEGVDPCGENGEFHTFVFDGPIFKHPVAFEIGEIVQRSYQPQKNADDNCFKQDEKSWDSSFWYCDLLPK